MKKKFTVMKKSRITSLITGIVLAFGSVITLAQDPCTAIQPVTASTTYAFALPAGAGMLDANCSGSQEEGTEVIYAYAAGETGLHALDILTHNNALPVAVMYKDAAGGCNSSGWVS